MADRTVSVEFVARHAGFTSGVQAMKRDVVDLRGQIAQSARQNAADWQALGRAGVVAGGAMSAGLGAAVTTFHGFQREMNRVGALTGATGEQFERLGGLAQELGRTTVFTASQSADALGFLAMAGFDAETAMSALPETLTLAAAAGMDLARAADITTNILTGFGMETSELAQANDQLVATFTNSNTSMEQLGEAMKYAAPLASAAGVEFAEVAAAIGLMGNAGIQGSMAGTSLRGALTRLLNPTAQVQSALDQLGVSVRDSSGEVLPLADLLDQLGASGADAGQLMQIFGQRAGPAMAALLSQGADELRVFTQDLRESGGLAEEIADRQLEGLHGSLIRFRSAAEGAAIALGEGLAPAIGWVADRGAELLAWYGALPGPLQQAIAMTGAATAGTLLLGGAAMIAVPRMVALHGSFLALTGSATALAGAKGLLTAAASRTAIWSTILMQSITPMGLALTAAGVGAAGLLLALHRLNDGQQSVAETSEALAASLGLTYGDLATSAAELGDQVAQTAQQFFAANAEIIAQLRQLDAAAAQDHLIQIGWQLVMHGSTAEEAFAAVQQLADQADVTLSANFDASVFEDAAAAIDGIGRRLDHAAETAAWWASGMTSELARVGEEAAHLFAEGQMASGLQQLVAAQEHVESLGLHSGEAGRRIASMIDAFAEGTGLQGATDGLRDVQELLRGVAEGSIEAAPGMQEVAQALLDLGDGQVTTAEFSQLPDRLREIADEGGPAAAELLELADGLEVLSEEAEQISGPLAQLGYDLEQLGNVSEAVAQRWVDVAGQFLDTGQVIQRAEAETRAAAEQAAEEHNAAIDRRISRLKRGSTEQRAALQDQKSSWEDFADAITMEQVTRHLEDVNQEFRDWQGNIQTIAQEVGGDVAGRLAMMGPEWAPIVAEAVDATAEEIARLDQALVDNIDLQMATAKMAVQMEVFEERVRQGGQATAESIAEATGIALDVVREMWSDAGLDPLELDIDPEAAFLELDEAERRAAAWADAEFVAWVDAHTDPVDRKVYSVEQLLEAYQRSNPTATLFARDEASSVIDRVRENLRRLDGANAFVNVRARGAQIAGINSYGGITQHDGGPAGRGPLHTGPLRPDEIPAVLQHGEYVVQSSAVDRYGLQMLEAINAQKFHGGGSVGPGVTSGGYFDIAGLFAMTRGASFGDAAGHLRAIEQMEAAYRRMQHDIEQMEESKRRQEILDRIAAAQADLRAAENREERVRAHDARADARQALEDHDRQARLAAERRQIEDRLEQARRNQQMAANREQLEFEQMTLDQQLANLATRQRAEQRYTDEWVQLHRQRLQLLEQEADATRSTYDTEWDATNRMLDERSRLLDQITQLEERHGTEVAAARRRHADAQVAAEEQLARRVADARAAAHDRELAAVERRAGELTASVDFADDPWNWRASTIASELDRQVAELGDWRAALDEALARGVDHDVIELLGLDRGPEALGQLTVLLRSTDDEIADLNLAAGRRQQTIADTVAGERLAGHTRLARELADIEAALADDLAGMRADHAAERAQADADLRDELLDLERDYHRELTGLQDDLAAIGADTGRSYAEAIAEAIASGIPGVVAQAERLQAALRDVKAAEAALAGGQQHGSAPAAMSREQQIRNLFDRYGVKYGRHADGSWEHPDARIARLVAGGRSLSDLERSISALPTFHGGGILPGAAGSESIYRGLGGEGIFTTDQMRAIGVAVSQPQVVVVERTIEVIPDGAIVEMHSDLGEVVHGTIRTAQADHDRQQRRDAVDRGRQTVGR